MSSRPQKWDWSSHLPKMIELYNTQMSIPDIYKAIQCEGFEPCQRSVYAKFKSMGYPTDPVGRSKLLDARSPSNTTAPSDGIYTPTNQLQSPALFAVDASHNSLCPLPEDHMVVEQNGWDDGFKVGNALPVFDHGNMHGFIDFAPQMQSELALQSVPPSMEQTNDRCTSAEIAPWSSPGLAMNHTFAASTTSFESTFDFESAALELNGAEYFGIDTGIHVTHPIMEEQNVDLHGTEDTVWNIQSPFTPTTADFGSSRMDIDHAPSFRDELVQPQPRRSGSFKSGSIDIKMPFQNFMANSNTAGTRNRLRSLFRTKSGNSIKSNSSLKKYAASHYTANTQDSGYGSGFGSSLTLDEVRQISSQSLKEFNGLYRVACQHLHEPRGKAQCKDIPTCSYCRYSSIHNLGWSARYLKLEVFLSELRLEGVYNFAAVDAAGNTALHYAAAGGASFRHLKALMDAGVDAYAANTTGELFISCLRPLQPFTLEPNSDCLKSDDLVHLLNILNLERISDWRDNDGQTVLHALFSKISEPDLRQTVYGMFVNAGYLPSVRDRFGRTAKDVIPLTYDCHGQVIDSDVAWSRRTSNDSQEEPGSVTCQDMVNTDWRAQQVRQIKAQHILAEALRQPKFTDPKSNDNVLHALSRLKNSNDTLLNLEQFRSKLSSLVSHTREGSHILLNLEHFISQGADLNLHNREGCFPLKAFICDRPWEDSETGATLSKYLDTMLWKDYKTRLPNNINVNMKDRDGVTALHCAAVRGRPDSVRSLIEAGACVNAKSDDGMSVLQAAFNASNEAIKHGNSVLVHLMKEVISHLEHAGAVLDPKSLQERGCCGQ